MIYPIYPHPFLSAMMLDDQRQAETLLYAQRLLADVFRAKRCGLEFPGLEPISTDCPFLKWSSSSNGAEWIICYFLACIEQQLAMDRKASSGLEYLKQFAEKRHELPKCDFVIFPNVTKYRSKPIHVAYRLWLIDKWKVEKPTWIGKSYSFRSWTEFENTAFFDCTRNVDQINALAAKHDIDCTMSIDMPEIDGEDYDG